MAHFDSTDVSQLMRSAVKVMADRFTHSETASAAIVKRSLQIIVADPELLSNGSREHFSRLCDALPSNTLAFSTTCRLRKQSIIAMTQKKDGNSAQRHVSNRDGRVGTSRRLLHFSDGTSSRLERSDWLTGFGRGGRGPDE